MLLTLILWALMAALTYVVGSWLVPPRTFARSGDRILAALWVGFVIVSNIWLAFALFLPLTFWRTLGVTTFVLGGLQLYRWRRDPARNGLATLNVTALPSGLWLTGAAGLAELALLRSAVVAYGDTPNYHYQSVLWLETYGVTPGVALLDCRLGFASAWYAFVAPFDACMWWHKRIGGAGGFPMALLWLHICLTIARAQRNAAQVSDWFMLVAGGLMFALFTYTYVALDSLSTDTPTLTLVVAAVWALLRGTETPPHAAAAPDGHRQRLPATIAVPVVLAFGAFTCKLSSTPTVAGVVLWALWQTRHQPRRWLGLVVSGMLLAAPVTVARWMMSGYPLFPSALGAYPVEWAYPPAKLEPLRVYIREFVRWSWHLPPYNLETSRYSAGWWDFSWLPRWLQIETVLALYLVVSFITGVALLARRTSHRDARPWVVGIAWAGIAYVFAAAPTLRYGLSFFVILPALWIAHFIADRRTVPARWALVGLSGFTIAGMGVRTVWLGFTLHRTSMFLTIAACVACVGLVLGFGEGALPSQPTALHQRQVGLVIGIVGGLTFGIALLLSVFRLNQLPTALTPIIVRPAALHTPEVVVRRINDVAVYQPVHGPCWAAPLPCGLEIDPHITLRDSARGLVAGFKRRTDAGSE